MPKARLAMATPGMAVMVRARKPEHTVNIYGTFRDRETLLGYLKGQAREKRRQINAGTLSAGQIKNLQVHVEACKQLQATVAAMPMDEFTKQYGGKNKPFNVEMELHKVKMAIESRRTEDEDEADSEEA